MQVELGMVSKEQLDNHAVGEQQKYILQPTRMDYRLILKSLGGKSTIKDLVNYPERPAKDYIDHSGLRGTVANRDLSR